MPPTPLHFDHNATTPIDPEVLESMARAWRDLGGNPASQHALGRKARRVLEEAREGIVSLLGGRCGGLDADRLIFTSGGTEANNLAIMSAALPERSPILLSAIEHPSLSAPAAKLAQQGHPLRRILPDEAGVVTAARLAEQFAPVPRMIGVMLANNETGVLQPVAELATLRDPAATWFHCDAVQAIGKVPVDFATLGVDSLTVTPHKFHGPIGIGGLLLRHGRRLEPMLAGGFQQAGLRPGTEPVPLAIGFLNALTLRLRELDAFQTRASTLQQRLEAGLGRAFPDAVVVGAGVPRLPTTTCIAFPGINRQALAMALDLAGLACATGSACASGSSEPSPVLLAMGLPTLVVEGAIRLSFGAFTTEAEIDRAIRLITTAVSNLRR